VKVDSGVLGWAAVAAVVTVADVYGERTMSDAFRSASRHKAGRWAVGATWLFLTAHLFVLPARYDPLTQAWIAARKRNPQTQ
jgi:hypothetical protein